MFYTSPAASSTSSSAKRFAFLFALLVAALSVACSSSSSKSATSTAAPPSATQAVATSAATSSADVKTTVAPAATPASSAVASDETVKLQTPDGVVMQGHLFASPGPKRRILVIAVYAPDSDAVWSQFSRDLATQGVAVMTLTLPAYADSNGSRDVSKADSDLELAVQFVESRDYPLVYLLGDRNAGVGAIKLAARHPIAGLITVSSPTLIGPLPGYSALPDLPKVQGKKLFVTGTDGTQAVVDTFMQAATDPKQSKVFASNARGAGLLSSSDGDAFKALLSDFLTK